MTKKRRRFVTITKKLIKELESQRDKLMEYDNHLEILEDRNSYSKTDGEFIIDFLFFPNPTDTLIFIPFLDSFPSRYNRLPATAVADSSYGSEENYRFMQENGRDVLSHIAIFVQNSAPAINPTHSILIVFIIMCNRTIMFVRWANT